MCYTTVYRGLSSLTLTYPTLDRCMLYKQVCNKHGEKSIRWNLCLRVRQLYKDISMLFLFPVKDGKLITGVNATFNASCYG